MKKRNYGEGDLLVDVLGSQGEKLTLLAKNARQSRKRFSGGVLDPLQFTELSVLSRSRGFDFVTEGKIIYPFQKLRLSYSKLSLAFYCTKIVNMVSMDGMDENKSLFDLLGNTLRRLEKTNEESLLRVRFQLKLLFYLGLYSPVPQLRSLTALPISAPVEESLSHQLLSSAQNFIRKKMIEIDLPFTY